MKSANNTRCCANRAVARLIGISSSLLLPLLMPGQAMALQKQELLEAISTPARHPFSNATKRRAQLSQVPTQEPEQYPKQELKPAKTAKAQPGRAAKTQTSGTQAQAPRWQESTDVAERSDSVLTIRNQRYLLELVECDFSEATNHQTETAMILKLYARQSPGRQGAELWISQDGAESYTLLFASDKPRSSYQAQQVSLGFTAGWLQWHGLVEGRDGPLPLQLRLRCDRRGS